MSFSYSKESIEELRSQIDIVDVIGRVVQLKRAGANFKGLCPFHNEKTPSFVVSPQKQIFTCFGCGASGDLLGFVKRYYNLDFSEAVEKLAGEYGINIQKNVYNDDREKYYEINREAARFFYRSMTESANAGYTYMKGRQIEDATIAKFGLGYADERWDSLYRYFQEKGTDEKLLLELGLIAEKGGRYYDKFRNRVMFPIINTSGRVIGFGGRALESAAAPKYLNSPENRVFQKKNNLYALNLTRQDIGKEGSAIIVEGYMDVISLYQAGVKNVAASLGTALTDNQAKLISRYTKNVVLSYDADAAGQKAALRGIEVLRGQDCRIRVLHVTDGKDPDEYIKKNGREAFVKLAAEAMPYVDYKLEAAKRDLDMNSEEGKLDYMKRIKPVLNELSPVEADLYIKKIAREVGIAEGAIKLEISGNTKSTRPVSAERKADGQQDGLSATEATVLKCLLTEPPLTEDILAAENIFGCQLARRVADIIFELYGTKGDFDLAQINDLLEPAESEKLAVALDNVVIAGKADEVLAECLQNNTLRLLREREKRVLDLLSLADEEANADSARELTLELMEIQREMKAHGGKKHVK